MALAAEEAPSLEACRSLCEASTTGMDRGELVELLLRLSEGRAGLEQMLDELSDQQQGLRDESARIHKEIKELHEGYLSPGAAASEWQFFQRPRVLGQLWEQAKALPSAESMAKGVAPANFGKQIAEQWTLFGQQAASQLGSTLFRKEESPPSPKAGSLLVRLVLDEAYRQAAQRQEPEQEEVEPWPSDDGLESPVEEEASSESSGSRSRAEELYQKTGCKLWSVPSQWQDFGKLFSKTFYSRPEAKRAAAAAAEPLLGRLVLDDVYRKVAAQGAAREQRLLGDQGAASALRAVTLHWQHFGAPGRGAFKEAERKAPAPVSGLWGALEQQARGESEESDESDTDERDSPTSAGSSVLQSPRALGQQLLGSWQSWGKKVNEQLSDYVSQGSVGWQSLKQAANGAFAEPDLQKAKKKAKKRAKREAMREAENDPDAPAFSRVLLEVSVRLGDGAIAPLEVSTNEHCREAASRFAKQHGLPSALRRGLRARLRQAVRTATSLPARLEVDLAEVQRLAP